MRTNQKGVILGELLRKLNAVGGMLCGCVMTFALISHCHNNNPQLPPAKQAQQVAATVAKVAMDFSKCSGDGNGSTARWLGDGRIEDAQAVVHSMAGNATAPRAIVTDILCGLYALSSMQIQAGETGRRASPTRSARKALVVIESLCGQDVQCSNAPTRPCVPPGEARALFPGERECDTLAPVPTP